MQAFFGILGFLNIASKSSLPLLAPIPPSQLVLNLPKQEIEKKDEKILDQAKIALDKRWHEKNVNDGFRDNILLSLHYLKKSQNDPNFDPKIDWEKLQSDFSVEFRLEPGEVFAFHKNILPKYKNKKIKTMGTEFVINQGYKFVSGLGGNGVCHLASLINWTASEAGLIIQAPTDHSFARIEGVPREYWTSIRYRKSGGNSQNQNLYIVNDKDFGVKFVFEKEGEELRLKILRI